MPNITKQKQWKGPEKVLQCIIKKSERVRDLSEKTLVIRAEWHILSEHDSDDDEEDSRQSRFPSVDLVGTLTAQSQRVPLLTAVRSFDTVGDILWQLVDDEDSASHVEVVPALK